MKKLFTAIKNNNKDLIIRILDMSPELINSIVIDGPKKFHKQSLLQVALKVSDIEIVELLLSYNPNVNYIEDEECINSWRAPVIHDAINRAIMNSRWNVIYPDELKVFSDQKNADGTFELLKKIIDLGADVNSKDSYGNACMDRACIQASQILPSKNGSIRLLTQELKDDLSRIFDLLIKNGADMSYIAPNAFGKSYFESYQDSAVINFIGGNTGNTVDGSPVLTKKDKK